MSYSTTYTRDSEPSNPTPNCLSMQSFLIRNPIIRSIDDKFTTQNNKTDTRRKFTEFSVY